MDLAFDIRVSESGQASPPMLAGASLHVEPRDRIYLIVGQSLGERDEQADTRLRSHQRSFAYFGYGRTKVAK